MDEKEIKNLLAEAEKRLKAIEEESKKLTDMIAFLHAAVTKGTSPLPDPIVTPYDGSIIGSGNYQHTYSAASGTWSHFTKSGMYDNNGAFINTTGSYVEFRFTGTKVEWISEKFPSHGIANIYIDGVLVDTADQYAASEALQQSIWTSSTLSNGPHTIRLEVSGERNGSSSGNYLVHDMFKVYSPLAPEIPVEPSEYDFVVSPNGVGASPGSVAAPMSLATAMTQATTGQTVALMGGTYRMTVTPTNNGVKFLAYPGQVPVISGLNAIANEDWIPHSGNIYKVGLSNGPLFKEYLTGFSVTNFSYPNNEILAQQVFKDGEMQFLAQWPKVSSAANYLERSSMRGRNNTSTFSQTQIIDSALGTLTNLAGARIWINGWFLTYTRTISSHSGNTINYSSADGNINFYKFYRVFDKLGLLTQPKEWHYDGSTLYFWQTGGGSPTGVEYKARNYGFDLQSKTGTIITGIQFKGCDPVITNTSSTNTTIDNIKASYLNHCVLETRGGANGYHDSAVQTGMKVLGSGSVVRNSEFRYAAGQTIWIGSNVTIQNNYFENGSYCGQYSGFVKPIWGAGGSKILYNTMTRCGRGHIEFTPETSEGNTNIEIAYNDFSKHIMLNVDGGSIYGSRRVDLTGGNIHHNWFHNDGGYDEGGVGQQYGIQVNGVYWDQASGPATVHHNIFWNGINAAGRSQVYSADMYNQIAYPENGTGRIATGGKIYNNTFASTNQHYSYVTYTAYGADEQRNNIYRQGLVFNWGSGPSNVANNLNSGSNPLFVGGSLSSPQTYFQLQSGSPARGIATTIAGINDDDTGAKDAGALPYDQAGFVAGYVPVAYEP